jgi:hypothetical protein
MSTRLTQLCIASARRTSGAREHLTGSQAIQDAFINDTVPKAVAGRLRGTDVTSSPAATWTTVSA